MHLATQNIYSIIQDKFGITKFHLLAESVRSVLIEIPFEAPQLQTKKDTCRPRKRGFVFSMSVFFVVGVFFVGL